MFKKINNPMIQFTFKAENQSSTEQIVIHFSKHNAIKNFLSTLNIAKDINEK